MSNPTPTNQKWSPAHTEHLRAHYHTQTLAAIGIAVGRTVRAVRQKATMLALDKTAPPAQPAPGLRAIPKQAISNHGKFLLSPIASPAELAARRKSERLEIATRTTPMCNSAMTGIYTGPELQRNPGIPDSRLAAFALPSRVGQRLHYPDGRVEVIAS